MITLVGPHPYVRAPSGVYTTLDEQSNPYWPNLFIVPSFDFPEQVLDAVVDEFTLNTGPFIPLTEEAVPACGLMNDAFASPGINTQQALICTSRSAQRSFIENVSKDLNPDWAPLRSPESVKYGKMHIDPPFYEKGSVVKSAASTLGRGVEFVDDIKNLSAAADEVERRAYRERMRVRRIGGTDTTIVEERVFGDALEVDCVVDVDGNITYLATLIQRWSDDGRVIVKYDTLGMMHPAYGEAIDVTEALVTHLGLQGCGFSAEYRWTGDCLKVIEIHARVGEDSGVYADLVGWDVPQKLYDAVDQ